MKTTIKLVVSSVLGTVLFASTAFAGINYTEYRKQVESAKEAASVAPAMEARPSNKHLVKEQQGTPFALTPVERGEVPSNKHLRSR